LPQSANYKLVPVPANRASRFIKGIAFTSSARWISSHPLKVSTYLSHKKIGVSASFSTQHLGILHSAQPRRSGTVPITWAAYLALPCHSHALPRAAMPRLAVPGPATPSPARPRRAQPCPAPPRPALPGVLIKLTQPSTQPHSARYSSAWSPPRRCNRAAPTQSALAARCWGSYSGGPQSPRR